MKTKILFFNQHMDTQSTRTIDFIFSLKLFFSLVEWTSDKMSGSEEKCYVEKFHGKIFGLISNGFSIKFIEYFSAEHFSLWAPQMTIGLIHLVRCQSWKRKGIDSIISDCIFLFRPIKWKSKEYFTLSHKWIIVIK